MNKCNNISNVGSFYDNHDQQLKFITFRYLNVPRERKALIFYEEINAL
jgi:hypothetical protein